MHPYLHLPTYFLVLALLLWAAYATMKKLHQKFWSYALVTLIYAASAGLAALLLSREIFSFLSMLSYEIFGGGVILLILLAYFARREFKLLCALFITLAVITVAIAIDAFVIEPHWLEVSRITIATAKIDRPVTIAVVADLQTDHVGNYEQMVLRKVMAEKPDMIIMPGDYIHCMSATTRATQRARLNSLLKSLKFNAPLGVFAVQGNVDGGSWTDIFKGIPVTAFQKTGSSELKNIRITGLSFNDSFNPAFRTKGTDKYHIVVGHGPDFALGRPDADLLLAGHTHGGQVQLPFIGPLLTFSRVPKTWGKGGVAKVDTNTTLIVSRGIGMERALAPRLRFLCRPQLIFVNLVPKD